MHHTQSGDSLGIERVARKRKKGKTKTLNDTGTSRGKTKASDAGSSQGTAKVMPLKKPAAKDRKVSEVIKEEKDQQANHARRPQCLTSGSGMRVRRFAITDVSPSSLS